nr:MAG TPA: hypothetical protein [Caudoviricetes sp.]
MLSNLFFLPFFHKLMRTSRLVLDFSFKIRCFQ